MFDMEKLTRETLFPICIADVVFEDNRTGERIRRTFYRPGKAFPIRDVEKELADYGFKLITFNNDTSICGKMDWPEIFGRFMEEESENDRP